MRKFDVVKKVFKQSIKIELKNSWWGSKF